MSDTLTDERLTIQRDIQSIQDELVRETSSRRSTSAPEIEGILKKALEYQSKFDEQMQVVANVIRGRPQNVSEINGWYMDCKQVVDLAQDSVDFVEHLRAFELPQQVKQFNKESVAKELSDFMSWKMAMETMIQGLQPSISAADYTTAKAQLDTIESAIPSDGSLPEQLLQQQTALNTLVQTFSKRI